MVMPLAQLVFLDEYVDGWWNCEFPNVSWAVLVQRLSERFPLSPNTL